MNLQVFVASLAGTGVEFLETAVIAYRWREPVPSGKRSLERCLGICSSPSRLISPGHGLRVFLFISSNAESASSCSGSAGRGLIKSVRRKRHKQRPEWVDDPLRGFQSCSESGGTRFNFFTTLVMTKSAAIEAFEICMIVSALAVASGAWGSPLAGMTVALLGTGCLVIVAKGTLQHVPEVDFKLWTGALLLSIGLWWLYEGSMNWP